MGGLAVVAYGHLRFTADIDLFVDLEESNLRRALEVFSALGYQPRAPVSLEEFADPARRRAWAAEKGLTVFSLFSDRHAATEVDLFVEAPFPFGSAYARASKLEVASGVKATFVSLEDLLALKRGAGRPQDLDDIERLEALRERHDEH